MSEPTGRERRHRAAVWALAQGVVFHDRTGAIVDANPAAEGILGLSLAEMQAARYGDPGWDAVDAGGEKLAHGELPSAVCLRTGRSIRNFIVGIATGDGKKQRRWFAVDAAPLYEDDEPGPSCVCTVFTDVTEQRRALIAAVQDITESRGAERERQALRMQLHYMQRLDALGTLAGGIAHDLNNTLVPVLGLSDALRRSMAEDDSRRRLVDVIHNAGERARDLVEQIHSFARRQGADGKPMDPGAFVRETMILLRAGIPSRIEIVQDIQAVPRINADAVELHQVLVHLCANAEQAMGTDVGQITVSLREAGLPGKAADGPPTHVCIGVADTGCGTDEAERSRAPFDAAKNAGAGTALGLSVVHGIVTAHGGEIRVSSKPGEGSRFDVYLPILTSEVG